MNLTLSETWSAVQEWLNTTLIQLGERAITPGDILYVLFVFALLVVIARLTAKGVGTLIERRGGDRASIYNITRLYQIVFWIFGILLLLDLIGIGVSSIFAIFAALGIGIGFGLQNLFNNAISGVILLIERPVRVGDLVELGERFGTVSDIGWRASRILTFDAIEIVVPNSRFLDQDLINWTLSDPLTRLKIEFGVSYKSDPEQVRAVALEVAHEHEKALDDPAPVVFFEHYGDSSIDFSLRYWVNTPWERFRINSEMRYRLFAALREHGIEIPFPQRDLHLKSWAPPE